MTLRLQANSSVIQTPPSFHSPVNIKPAKSFKATITKQNLIYWGILSAILILSLSACGKHKARAKTPIPPRASSAKGVKSSRPQIPTVPSKTIGSERFPSANHSGIPYSHTRRDSSRGRDSVKPSNKNRPDYISKGGSHLLCRRLLLAAKGAGSFQTADPRRDTSPCGARDGGNVLKSIECRLHHTPSWRRPEPAKKAG